MAGNIDFVGLNIGHSSIKLASINKAKDGSLELLGLSNTPTSLDFSSDRSAVNSEKLVSELQLSFKNSKFRTKSIVISMSETEVFSRLLTLPVVSESEIPEAINWALKPMVPVSMDSLNISFVEIDRKKTGNSEMVNWYVVAAPKERVNQYVDIFSKAGLTILAVETESLALCRVVQHSYEISPEEDIFIMDLGAENTNVILARGGVPIFSQSISTGSEALTKVIASDFGIDEQKAEEYKIQHGILMEGEGEKIGRSILPILDLVTGESLRTLRYYTEKIKGQGIKRAFITGGGSALKGIASYFQNKSGLTTEVANLLANIKTNIALADNKKNIVNSFNVAIGLALKGFI